jgi:hypothetical protein
MTSQGFPPLPRLSLTAAPDHFEVLKKEGTQHS